MLRTLVKPRVLALHLVAIIAVVACTLLGRWQLGVFQDSGRPKVKQDPAPVAVTSLVQAGQPMTTDMVSRRVTAEGVYEAGRRLLVAHRTADSADVGGRAAEGEGYWVLLPLRLADGTLVPVVRGWVATPDDPAAAAVPGGTVTVTGRMLPAESSQSVYRGGLAVGEGQVLTVSTAELINLWRGERLRPGFVVAMAEQPPAAPAPKPVAVSPPTEPGGFTWLNFGYALQWWIFGLFAVYMWFHFVRDAVRQDRAARQGAGQGREPEDEPAPAPDIVV